MVSMLVSFTLTPMLSSRFLKPSDGAADLKSKERGFFHWLDERYARWLNWSLDHPGAIFAHFRPHGALIFPLNRMVGREFVPDEDMGEWIVHLDAPEGTSLEGSDRGGVQASQGGQRHRRRGAHRALHRRVRRLGRGDTCPS